MSAKASNYIVFDFETGGLSAKKNAATEIAMMTINAETLEEIERMQMLILPYDPELTYESKALEVTGISMNLITTQGKNLHDDVVPAMKGLIQRANTAGGFKHKPILVGHNPLFDWGFMQQLGEKTKTDWTKLLMGGKDNYTDVWVPKMIDTIDDAKQIFQGLDETKVSYTLSNVAEYLNIPLSDAHRAMVDVEVTANVFRETVKRKRATGGGSQQEFRAREHFQIA